MTIKRMHEENVHYETTAVEITVNHYLHWHDEIVGNTPQNRIGEYVTKQISVQNKPITNRQTH